jgi:alcohol dehydrogenase class IV
MQRFTMGHMPGITFGAGRLTKLPSLAKPLGTGPLFIIADAALVALGVVGRLAKALAENGLSYELAADIAGEPKEALIDDLSARARACGTSCVIGLGGGAALDSAKLVATIAPSGAPVKNFALGAQPLPKDGVPAIAIPTTAGTGSEGTRIAVISDANGRKYPYFSDALTFTQVILDPELTVSLPPHLTAWTGIDAVVHALEGATARKTSPVGQMFGLEALRILGDALPRAVADGSDLETRGRVLWASMLAGVALNNCSAHMGHAISHGIGSLAPVHHGHVTGLGLEVALPWLVARPEGAERYALASKALGGEQKAKALPAAFSTLMRAIGIAPELPASCASLRALDLATEMKAPANIGMAKNAACKIADTDLDELAARILELPIAKS